VRLHVLDALKVHHLVAHPIASVPVFSSPREGASSLDAEAKGGFAMVKETFATRVKLNAVKHTIEVGLLYGPFRKFRNHWRFLPTKDGTKVEFEIDFEFKSRILDAILAANLHRAAEKLIGCFEARAKALYGATA
jgi:coenzyme Q-binding protein COQ10